MNAYLQTLVEGKIDFEGQKAVETITKYALIGATVVSFLTGFLLQSLTVTFAVYGVTILLLCLLVIPQWPMYNRHPVKWLPAHNVEKVE